LALCQRGKEAFDSNYYSRAEQAINQALQIDPKNFEAEKAGVVLALGRHEYGRARELAMVLNKRVPDDVAVYGYLVDANVALGNYHEAEEAAQWMLNLRPANVPALVRTARLREVFGDQEGAIEVLRMILDSTIASDIENRSWAFNQIGRLYLETGKLDAAQSMFYQALTISPDCSGCLRGLAQLRLMQNRAGEAVELLRKSYGIAPHLETRYELGAAQEAAGRKDDAMATFSQFEQGARAASELDDNANRELIFFYLDRVKQPAAALRVARIEIARRHDVPTLDAFAWALYGNGQYLEAKQQIDLALKVGVRESPIFYHAGQIASRLGDTTQAEHFLRMAAELGSAESKEAQKALAQLQVPNASK
jgi:tetratricopeptide (TPR) repeat protein